MSSSVGASWSKPARAHPSGGFHLAFRITEKGMLTARWRACLQRFRQQAMLQFKVKQVSEAIDPMALNTIGVDHGDLGFPTVETDQITGPLCPPPGDRSTVPR